MEKRRNNDRPTIGIVTQPTFGQDYRAHGSDYVAGGYVKWAEMAGVQAFVVPWNATDIEIRHYLSKANGFLFPGGPQVNTSPPSEYFKKIQRIYDLVIDANQQGNYFTLLGICQGFEQLILSATNFGPQLCIPSGGTSCVKGTSNVLLPCHFTEHGLRSRMLNSSGLRELDEEIRSTLRTPITPNFHSNAVFPSSFDVAPLGRIFEVIATSSDSSGTEFVSMVEGKNGLPVYGLQWHPSLQVFEWNNTDLSCLTHTPEAILVMQYLANFIASELRKSPNQFDATEFEAIKFSKLPVVYSENFKDGPIYENAYFFGPPADTEGI